MKKIFIAVLCIIPLCLTSCASAPEEELSQEAAPQLETSETELPETSEEDENTDSEEQNPDNEIPGETETENAETSETEEFPEPADFLEPEVITLEPIEEIEPAENLPESEEVENEEPPQIIVPDENNTAEYTIDNQYEPSIPEIPEVLQHKVIARAVELAKSAYVGDLHTTFAVNSRDL